MSERSARSRATILKAARELVQERGYGAVSMDGIAARARVGKPTLYRWWPSKAALILAAALEEAGEVFVVPDTGDIRADLSTLVVRACEVLGDDDLRPLFAGVVGAAQSDPPTNAAVKEIHHALRGPNQERIIAAQLAGELPQGDPELLEDMLVGAMWYRTLITGGPIDRAFADTVVAKVLGEPTT
ncbi:TetR/AcrR family transcriptional regulator [Nocardia sp. NPDC127526]|uniref:TetR/AcrR family transcriptional regulator n=1 Tax=Nocardia sp. NPDC127526 TaxID=3345393 RepID=UPI00362B84AD